MPAAARTRKRLALVAGVLSLTVLGVAAWFFWAQENAPIDRTTPRVEVDRGAVESGEASAARRTERLAATDVSERAVVVGECALRWRIGPEPLDWVGVSTVLRERSLRRSTGEGGARDERWTEVARASIGDDGWATAPLPEGLSSDAPRLFELRVGLPPAEVVEPYGYSPDARDETTRALGKAVGEDFMSSSRHVDPTSGDFTLEFEAQRAAQLVSGVVLSESGAPVEGAYVRIEPLTEHVGDDPECYVAVRDRWRQTFTDADGRFALYGWGDWSGPVRVRAGDGSAEYPAGRAEENAATLGVTIPATDDVVLRLRPPRRLKGRLVLPEPWGFEVDLAAVASNGRTTHLSVGRDGAFDAHIETTGLHELFFSVGGEVVRVPLATDLFVAAAGDTNMGDIDAAARVALHAVLLVEDGVHPGLAPCADSEQRAEATLLTVGEPLHVPIPFEFDAAHVRAVGFNGGAIACGAPVPFENYRRRAISSGPSFAPREWYEGAVPSAVGRVHGWSLRRSDSSSADWLCFVPTTRSSWFVTADEEPVFEPWALDLHRRVLRLVEDRVEAFGLDLDESAARELRETVESVAVAARMCGDDDAFAAPLDFLLDRGFRIGAHRVRAQLAVARRGSGGATIARVGGGEVRLGASGRVQFVDLPVTSSQGVVLHLPNHAVRDRRSAEAAIAVLAHDGRVGELAPGVVTRSGWSNAAIRLAVGEPGRLELLPMLTLRPNATWPQAVPLRDDHANVPLDAAGGHWPALVDVPDELRARALTVDVPAGEWVEVRVDDMERLFENERLFFEAALRHSPLER